MAYSTQTDIEAAAGGAQALIELCDLDGTGAGLNAAVLATAQADADAFIDSYVAKQRSVPLSPVPPVIKRMSAEETVYLLRMRRVMLSDFEQQRHEANIDWLKGVARGMYTLGVDPQPAKSALVSPAVVTVEDADAEITACNMRGFW